MTNPLTPPVSRLESTQWLDRFFEHYYRANPVNATFIGEHRFDPWLPDYSEAAVDDSRARVATLLAESSALSLDELTGDERHDVRLAQGALRIQDWELSARHFHRGNPEPVHRRGGVRPDLAPADRVRAAA